LIESLYIIDSAGICLISAPLMPVKLLNPELTGGFIVAEHLGFREAIGESPRKLSLEKREFLIRRVESRKKMVLIAIGYAIGEKKDERFAEAVLEGLAERIKKSNFFKRYIEGEAKVPDEDLQDAVSDTLKEIPCPRLVRGLLGVTNHCQKIGAPIMDNRPCNLKYAVDECQHYTGKV